MNLEPIWFPSEKAFQSSHIARFIGTLNDRYQTNYKTFKDLYNFSVSETETFWSEAWDFLNLIGDKGEPPFYRPADRFEDAAFFPDAKLNYAENLLRRRDDDPCIIFRGEDKVQKQLSWNELHDRVSQLQQALKELGVSKGDCVAALMPNMPETVIALLATASIGAIFSSASPDFGIQGVIDRFGQIEPKVMLTVDGYYYNGKAISIGDKVRSIVDALPNLRQTIVVRYLNTGTIQGDTSAKIQNWDSIVSKFQPKDVVFERLPFSHPLCVLYSSGTTGTPKCIIHSAGGLLIQLMKEHKLHCDLHPNERLFYFTTCGWMMWNWLVTGLASEATLILYDGSPFYPNGNVLFDYAERERINVFGTSPKFLDAVKKADLRPIDHFKLSSLRMMNSTGSPLAPEGFEFVYDAIKSDIHLASISGGTDICSCFVLGNPISPVYVGEIQGPGLGMAIEILDEEGYPQKSGKGELTCTKPFPSKPLGFWNDPDGQKYRNSYYERFPGVWYHGDFAEWTEHGGLIIHGRSDATLNPGGVRIGTAEIYRQVEQLEDVQESIVIGQDWDHDVRLILFVVLRQGVKLNDQLKQKIKTRIKDGASPRHVPQIIVQVPDIPRTKSGKITEIAVRDIVHGREIKNKEALANPEALDYYKGLEELKN